MYSGFVGTVWSHFFSLLSTIWATYKIYSSTFQYDDFFYVYVGLFLVFANSSLALVRYGHSDGYKLRRLHIITLNLSVILNFTIIEGLLLHISKIPWIYQVLPFFNIIPLLSNTFAKDYRTKLKSSDVFLAINSLFLFLASFFFGNYFGMAYSISYFFGYFFIGECGCFLDSEVPSVDAFQYLTCFLNFFSVYAVCY